MLSLFALGSSYQDISGHIAELYGIDVSIATISAVTDKLIPELREWQQRPLIVTIHSYGWMPNITK